MDDKFITAFQSDWPVGNLSVVKTCLSSAYEETNALCSPHRNSVFSTPNQYMHTGYTRFIAVSQKLDAACKAGRLPGVTAEWTPVNGNSGFWILELRGKFSRLIVCHIAHTEASPRDCVSRFDGRLSNQMLMGFEEEALSKQSPLLTLTLVHGHREAEFAFVRGYNDATHPSSYEQLSANIMELPVITPDVEEEPIDEPETDIKDHLRADEEDEEGDTPS